MQDQNNEGAPEATNPETTTQVAAEVAPATEATAATPAPEATTQPAAEETPFQAISETGILAPTKKGGAYEAVIIEDGVEKRTLPLVQQPNVAIGLGMLNTQLEFGRFRLDALDFTGLVWVQDGEERKPAICRGGNLWVINLPTAKGWNSVELTEHGVRFFYGVIKSQAGAFRFIAIQGPKDRDWIFAVGTYGSPHEFEMVNLNPYRVGRLVFACQRGIGQRKSGKPNRKGGNRGGQQNRDNQQQGGQGNSGGKKNRDRPNRFSKGKKGKRREGGASQADIDAHTVKGEQKPLGEMPTVPQFEVVREEEQGNGTEG